MVVVIPCYDEPNLLDSLRTLSNCDRPAGTVEVIVVINSAGIASASVKERNAQTLQRATAWARENQREDLRFHLLNFPELPRKHAGVGLARKIGMDEALSRFDAVERPDGIIVCFDADCVCDPNYLAELDRFFRANPKAPGASIYFEHPLEGPGDHRIYEAVTLYELHLRYYVEALRFAGFPHAYHTVGSSMAVPANVYQKQGGMNKRQAGEDFYFLHKIIPLGNFGEINSTRVIASPRPSERVPFGTGRAIRQFLDSNEFTSYPVNAFHDLKQLFETVPDLYKSDRAILPLPGVLRDFLENQSVAAQLEIIRKHTSSSASFQKRFFRWFDGFMAMKYIHFARDALYGEADLLDVSREIYERQMAISISTNTPRELLQLFRKHQRNPKSNG